MAIYRHDDGTYSASSRSVWLPGGYADERAANYAFRLPDAALSRLWRGDPPSDGEITRDPITFAELQALRRSMKGQRIQVIGARVRDDRE